MSHIDNTPERTLGLKELESIHDGLTVLAELSMRQADYVMAQKLRGGIVLAQKMIERARKNCCQPLALP